MDASDMVRTGGSAATAIAAIIALMTYSRSLKSDRRANQAKRADESRKSLREFAADVHTLNSALHDGTVIISAGAAISDQVFKRLAVDADVGKFWQFLSNDDTRLFLLFANEGLAGSAQMVELRRVVARLTEVANRGAGAFGILRPTSALLQSAFNDSCSVIVFMNILDAEKVTGSFKKEHGSTTQPADLASAFAQFLYGNAAMYYSFRYDSAMQSINEFVSLLSNSCSALSDTCIDKLMTVIPAPDSATQTRTQDMGCYLALFADILAPGASKRLNELVVSIEHQLSKAAAMELADESSVTSAAG